MADWGIRISKPTFDVKTCTDDQLVMTSSLNLLKTASVGDIGGTFGGSASHSLGYTPIFFYMPKYSGTSGGFVGQLNGGNVVTDSSNIFSFGQFDVYGGEVKYYLFYQEY